MTFDDLVASPTTPPATSPGTSPDTSPTPVISARRPSPTRLLVMLTAVAAAMGLWGWSLGRFRLAEAGNLGVLQAIPVPFALALLLMGVLFAVELARPQPSTPVLTVVVAGLVVIMFSVPNLVDGTGMMPVGYLHAGFSEYISSHHEILRGYDTRFYWPAFFAGVSVLVDLAGLPSPVPLLEWAPLFFELMALAPMLLLARSILGRGRTAWLAVVLYYSGCWFSQDYLAPQAMDHLLYLSAIAVLFWTVSGSPDPVSGRWFSFRGAPPPRGLTDGRAFGIQLAITVVIGAMVVTHQLTPVGFVIQLFVLSVIGGTRYRALWLVAALFTVAWFSYAARDFWIGHLTGLVDNVGQVNNAVDKGLSSRVSTGSGDPTYLRMQLLRTLWSGGFLVAGGIGAVVLLRRRNPLVIAAGACALTPFALILLQSYGGEIFLRCFLYSMPFLAVLTAAAISPLLSLPLAARAVAVAVVVVTATGGLVVTRGVNVGFERVSDNSVAAAEYLAGVSAQPARSPAKKTVHIGLAEYFAPVGLGDISRIRIQGLGKECETQLSRCARRSAPEYILLTTEQEQFGRLRMQLPEGWLMRAGATELEAHAGYRVVFERPGALVLKAGTTTGASAK